MRINQLHDADCGSRRGLCDSSHGFRSQESLFYALPLASSRQPGAKREGLLLGQQGRQARQHPRRGDLKE